MNSKKNIFIIVVSLFLFTFCGAQASEQHLLLVVSFYEGPAAVVLEILPTGEIVTTGQLLYTGYDAWQIAVSPDNRFILITNPPYGSGTCRVVQFEIDPYGRATATGRNLTMTVAPFEIAYTPNGKLVFVENTWDTYICRVLSDGSLEDTGNRYTAGGINISPIGNITLGFGANKTLKTHRIDYEHEQVIAIQTTALGADTFDFAYTPDGKYAAVLLIGTWTGPEIVIYQIAEDGTISTTGQRWDVSINLPSQFTITPDGKWLLLANASNTNGFIATYAIDSNGRFQDTGKRYLLVDPQDVVVSPDCKYIAVDHNVSGMRALSTFTLSSEGDLIPTGFSFPFQQTFGYYPSDIEFVLLPAITAVNPRHWQVYE
ncbi:MAG: beta-propeller fold lactonase family protein [bacterium]|nr:beta-propeller fold lactonase family protein [bacterium]